MNSRGRNSATNTTKDCPYSSPFHKVFCVEDELDVALGVRQTLFLQRLSELRRSAQEHAHFSPWVFSGDVAELVVPVRFSVQRLLFEASYRVVLCLVMDAEMSRLGVLPSCEVDVVAEEVAHVFLRHLSF